MGELLRAVLSRPGPKIVLLAIALGVVIWFVSAGLSQAGAADACADRLVSAVQNVDRAYVESTVRNPSLQKKLLSGASTELLFVRPISTEWTRVGLLVKTGTTAETVALQLEADGERCLFLRDF